MIDDLLYGARCDHLATVHAGSRADINNVVRVPDGVLVVFDHEHGITEISQVNQCPEQPLVVALMQANGGFIEDIHNANQASTDLTGESNTLCLTS